MAVTYRLIETVTVGSGGAASIEFGSIPQTYTDLVVVVSGRTTQAANQDSDVVIRFNGSSSNLSYRSIRGNGTGAASQTAYFGFLNGNSATASVFGSFSAYIPNYASSTAKSVSVASVTETNATDAYQALGAILWNDTSAITSLRILSTSSNLVQYSSASLYGIKNS